MKGKVRLASLFGLETGSRAGGGRDEDVVVLFGSDLD